MQGSDFCSQRSCRSETIRTKFRQVIENFKISIRIRLGFYFLLLENFGRVHRNQNKKLKATSINVTKYLFEFQRSSHFVTKQKEIEKKIPRLSFFKLARLHLGTFLLIVKMASHWIRTRSFEDNPYICIRT